MEDNENSTENLTYSRNGRKSRYILYLVGPLILGLYLTGVSAITLLWMVFSLDPIVLSPIELWIEGQNSTIVIIGTISIISIISISSLPSIIATGYVNRFLVHVLTKKKLPRNRKWLILQGLIVYVISMLLFMYFTEYLVSLRSTLTPWSETFPGSTGDFYVEMIISSLRWVFRFPVGLAGYLVAAKLPIFHDKPVVSAETL
ncbi:MAG: hypothetical protein RTV72_11605 [Candidatus Thorarchaeota archaeon]